MTRMKSKTKTKTKKSRSRTWLIVRGESAFGAIVDPEIASPILRVLRSKVYRESGKKVPVTVRRLREWDFSLPGMYHTGQPFTTVTAGDLSLKIPCHDVGVVLDDLKAAPLRSADQPGTPEAKDRLARRVGDALWYEIPGHVRALIIGPQLRADLISALELVADKAEERANVFFKTLVLEDAVIRQVMDRISDPNRRIPFSFVN